ncbi:MAG: DNA-binding protein [Rhizobiales bacterium 62-47]|nr:HPF/RaiA family ribosome-associated protein [Hyphomicrobiales bacterium]OJY08686.1 MAG: DNA-binding protein [Rhizobiales bacterium 62-47]
METPVEIDFQGMAPVEQIRRSIETHVAALEQRYGRITACRVAFKAPGGHHRKGLYEVSLRLALPNGREVNVARMASQDERYTDVNFAINDAFKRARRRLQDHVRRMQGHIKEHEAQPIGKVIRINPEDGFGFLETADKREIYFHKNSVLDGGFARLSVGARVAFAEEQGEKGLQASTVRLLGKHGMR